MNRGQKVLVTGGTGLVGSHLVAQLLSASCVSEIGSDSGSEIGPVEVTVIVRPGALSAPTRSTEVSLSKLSCVLGRAGFSLSDIELCEVDTADYGDVVRIVGQGYDVIYHCAARVTFAENDHSLVRDNVELTSFFVDAALATCSRPLFIHMSSVAALGSVSTVLEPITEKSVLANFRDVSQYAKSKFLSENELWRGAACGLRVIVVNASVVVGTTFGNASRPAGGGGRDGRGGALDQLYGYLCERALRFAPSGASGFVDVRDVARAMVLLASSEDYRVVGRRFVVSGVDLSFGDFVKMLNRGFGHRDADAVRIVPPWMLWHGIWFVSLFVRSIDRSKLRHLLSDRSYYDGHQVVDVLRDYGFRYTPFHETVASLRR